MTPAQPAQGARNTELYARRCAGETFGALGASYGISRARAHQIATRATARLAIGLPVTLPASSGAWGVVKAMAPARAAARALGRPL
jgi:hypothetical protein